MFAETHVAAFRPLSLRALQSVIRRALPDRLGSMSGSCPII